MISTAQNAQRSKERKYWIIGNKEYDLTPFLDKHPGGAQLLLLARERYGDCTFAFESHHANFRKVRAMLAKYFVRDYVPGPGGRPGPDLTDGTSFYDVLRDRVHAYLSTFPRTSDGRVDVGPPPVARYFYFVCLFAYLVLLYLACTKGSILLAVLQGMVGGLIGGFGHSFVHSPRYRHWAYFSLDILGLFSESWVDEHLLRHHVYTNTTFDNHFEGTDPFLKVDPRVKRHWLQKGANYYWPLVLWFGVFGNYAHNFTQVFVTREETFNRGILFWPVMVGVWCHLAGSIAQGLKLWFITHGVLGLYYFTIALANHNQEENWDVKGINHKLNEKKDWAEYQLIVNCDIGRNLSFWESTRFLWLNYHGIHHMFPVVDAYHHPKLQEFLIELTEERGLKYHYKDFIPMVKDMLQTFTIPRAIGEIIL